MPEKNNGKWTNRHRVQKAFDRDPQHAYNVVNSVITRQQAEEIEVLLFPPPSSEEAAAEAVAELTAMKEALEKHGLDTAEVDAKLAEIVAG